MAEVRKGEAAASEAVLTAPGEESCGLGLAEGGTYLVLAQQSSRSEREDLGIRYRANSCGGTRPVVDAPISNALGTPAEPEPLPVTESPGAQPAEDDDSWVAIWVLGAVAALVIGAVLVGGLARRRRSSST